MLMGTCAHEAQLSFPMHCLHCLLRQSLSSSVSPRELPVFLLLYYKQACHAGFSLPFVHEFGGTECCKMGTLPAELSHQLPAFIFNLLPALRAEHRAWC